MMATMAVAKNNETKKTENILAAFQAGRCLIAILGALLPTSDSQMRLYRP